MNSAEDEMRPRYVNLIVELLKLSNSIDYEIKHSRAHIHGSACSRCRDRGALVDLISTFTQIHLIIKKYFSFNETVAFGWGSGGHVIRWRGKGRPLTVVTSALSLYC